MCAIYQKIIEAPTVFEGKDHTNMCSIFMDIIFESDNTADYINANPTEFKRLIDDLIIDSSDIATIYLGEYLSFFTSSQETLAPFLEYERNKAKTRLLESYLIAFPHELDKKDSSNDVYEYFVQRMESGLGTDFLLTEQGSREYKEVLEKHLPDIGIDRGWKPVYENILNVLSEGKSGITHSRFEKVLMSIHHDGMSLDKILSDGYNSKNPKRLDWNFPYRAMFAWHRAREYGLGKLWHYLPQQIKSYIRENDWEQFEEMQKHELKAPLTDDDIQFMQNAIAKIPAEYQINTLEQIIGLEKREDYQVKLASELFTPSWHWEYHPYMA